MGSTAAAFAWEFRRRYRWGWIAIGAYFVAVAAIRFIAAWHIFDSNDPETFALFVAAPLTSACIYLLAIFTYGFSGDLAARQSIYPARMFTLPVTTRALVAWPMLYGSIAIAMLWLVTRLLGAWPSNVYVPL